MTKEEQLKVYSAYLPYKLLVRKKFGRYSPIKTEVMTIDDLKTFDIHRVFMPVLYPLEYLTKEIEHEGETFVPIVELLKIEFPNQKGRYAETEYSTEGHPSAWFKAAAQRNIRVRIYELDNEPFWIIKKLLEWHFNVFNLPQSEYINKATLCKD